ncbi:MAG: GNAT family N-acetyltransferase [Propionibacteriaceae bacterium]
MSDIAVRLLSEETDSAAVGNLSRYVWMSPCHETAEQSTQRAPWRALLGAETDDEGERRLVGIWGAYDLAFSLPGPLDTVVVKHIEGATWCSVHPEFRRRGILTDMITAHLQRCHKLGSFITVHKASEESIYGRFGYAISNFSYSIQLGKDQNLVIPDAVAELTKQTRVRSFNMGVELAERLTTLETACAATHLGGFAHNLEHQRADQSQLPNPLRKWYPEEILIATRDGVDVGFARIERESDWKNGSPTGKIFVSELETIDQAALVSLIKHITSFDLCTEFTFVHRYLDDPITQMIPAGPRSYGSPKSEDGVWLRIVDLPVAMTERGYNAPVDVAIAVTDNLCPWNTGTWRLHAGDDGVATCTATTSAPDISCDISHLNACYMGARSFLALSDSGMITEHTSGAIRRLSRAMGSDLPVYGGFFF